MLTSVAAEAEKKEQREIVKMAAVLLSVGSVGSLWSPVGVLDLRVCLYGYVMVMVG